VSYRGRVTGAQESTNQYTLGLAFSPQPGKVKKQPAAATSVKNDSGLLWESVGEKSC